MNERELNPNKELSTSLPTLRGCRTYAEETSLCILMTPRLVRGTDYPIELSTLACEVNNIPTVVWIISEKVPAGSFWRRVRRRER